MIVVNVSIFYVCTVLILSFANGDLCLALPYSYKKSHLFSSITR